MGVFSSGSIMHDNESPHIGPSVQPCRIGCRRVDAAVAHRVPEVVVPVRAVNSIAFIEVHHVGHIGQIITGAAHRLREILHVDVILPGDSGRARQARRDGHPIDRCISIIGY